MKIYELNKLKEKDIEKLCTRGSVLNTKVLEAVKKIEARVLKDGDKALKEFCLEFDKANIKNLKVSEKEFEEAEKLVDKKLKIAIKTAKENILKFHKSQMKNINSEKVETTKGVFCWKKFTPIEKVGLYIPGGSAPLFSTVLMLGIPAKIAKCKDISICTPPNKDGKIAPEILWTAKLLEIKNIYKVGGAQGIFAMANGTKTISKVDKIFGPGNAYVMGAKMSVMEKVAIDMPAGPSEVLVIGDKNSNPKFIAADILSQAEHGPDSQSIFVCDDAKIIEEVLENVKKQLKELPRKEIATEALKISFIIQTKNIKESFDFANLYAAEHLILSLKNFKKYLALITNAGSVFCGNYSAESFGDYASGTNHTLPTSGFAKSYSGLSVDNFGKWITFQEVTKKGFDNLADTVEIMAEKEKLFAHKNGVTIRRN